MMTVTVMTESSKRKVRGESGAVDLGSIMVGIIVVGVLGGIIAATVFAVIPWTQDNAARAQLKSVVDAQSEYNVSSDGKFADAQGLSQGAAASSGGSVSDGVVPAAAGLVNLDGIDRPVLVALNDTSDCYVSVIKSASGKMFSVTDQKTNPAEFERGTSPGCVDVDMLESEVAAMLGEEPVVPTSLMVSTWDIATNKTVQLPVQGTIAAGSTVDWGDGTVEPLANKSSHTYAAGSEATVTIDGQFTTWSMLVNTSQSQLKTITQWDDKVGTTDLTYGFYKADNATFLKEIPSTVTTLNSAFSSSFTFNGDISGWNTSNVTNMSNMFLNARTFNKPINFDTSNVTNMSGMFSGANAFNQPVNFDTSKVTTMATMFSNAWAFNQPVNFDTGNVTTMLSMFSNARAFNYPVEFDVTKTTILNNMFMDAHAFNQPVRLDTKNVISMGNMFQNARAFNQPLNFDTTNVTNMAQMFRGATVFNQNISSWNVEKVVSFTSFRTSSALSLANTPLKFR